MDCFLAYIFSQTIPGIGAGYISFYFSYKFLHNSCLGWWSGRTMISNFIDYHMRKSLNWSLAAAMGGVLLVIILFLYWIYDRVVGIDNMKLG